MMIIAYDGSWYGLMTLIFEVYEYRMDVHAISRNNETTQQHLFGEKHLVYTDSNKAERVLKGIVLKAGKDVVQELYCAYLSEQNDIELLILRLVQYYLGSKVKVSANYGHEDVLKLKQITKSVSRERHRFKAFVRFRQMEDGLYMARIEPDFNILPLISSHFKNRYADQLWLIYDVKRDYGIYYDKSEVTEVHFDFIPSDQNVMDKAHENELLYDDLWKRYFQSVNIKERKNMKLHIQHVPKRYWKYLNEKSLALG
ncbi:TIGR03915 family putative DNA repair protein [Sphingobacterium spiritivorum]|uniref:TIGR03915 family putative DNA repair protein n=1 Tax=Sphingobacterium spiritivorum TaxID=258 RepID=UPI0019196E08|nr:TIGR03915 family putative DNA repair protein [Sphingobacterium spiritivorum]QQT24636.1 TIGR03915 family putative DNA repair protein [Sphingobacterium spiritivorum]